MAPAELPDRLRVEVAYSPRAREVRQVRLELDSGATVLQALQASGLLAEFPQLDPDGVQVGVWGKLRALTDVLRDRDRVEIYRPLTVDPKEARRVRYRAHREKAGR